ncbi:MAG: SRPBCC family protein [Aquabacterium sp.]
MSKPSFVYVTYIATTPEKAWQAMIDNEMIRQYWCDPTNTCVNRENVSDWRPGSRWEHRRADGSGVADIVGTVIESTPPSRLVYSWARPTEVDDDSKHSRVSIDIEAQGNGIVRLMVTHEGLENDPQMLSGISGGWPKVLSNLKTFLESGRTLQSLAA